LIAALRCESVGSLRYQLSLQVVNVMSGRMQTLACCRLPTMDWYNLLLAEVQCVVLRLVLHLVGQILE
jgi:hypothetical protein